MRKKQKQAILLAAMVTLALQTENGLAATQITPDTYDEYQELGGETKGEQVQISKEGEYIFKNTRKYGSIKRDE